MILRNISRYLAAFAPAIVAAVPVAAQTGRLDFLKAKDSSFALFASTSATFQTGKVYPNALMLITGLPTNPVVAAQVPLPVGSPACEPNEPCGGVRNVALSPDGDTALVSSDSSDVQPPGVRGVSVLLLLRNVRTFVRSKNPSDLRMRVFRATEYPQLDNVSGLAFGPDGRWAVVSTMGPGPIDLTYKTARGTLVTITGLPDEPVFSAPFPVPMHSQGNIDLSVDGQTLLLNDVTDRSGDIERSNQIVVQGIKPGGSPPKIVGTATLALQPGAPSITAPVRDARLSVNGQFIVAPVPMVSGFGADGSLLGLNRIEILGPPQNGALPMARLLNAADGVDGGPSYAAISPDGDTALVVNALDSGAKLLTGLASDPSKIRLTALPFSPFSLPHVQARFTPDGDTALVGDWIIPPLADAPLSPTVSVLTGFQSGNIRLVTPASPLALNAFDNNQQIATVPAGLQDYVNLYVPAGGARSLLTSLLQDAIAQADRGNTAASVVALVGFIGAAYGLEHQGVVTAGRTTTMITQAAIGVQAVLTNQ
jgi:hypothetical protein